MSIRRDSFSILRDAMRWRVALVLAVLVIGLMVALGTLNTRLGYSDTAQLAWAVLAASVASVLGLLTLPRRLGGTIFFSVVALLLIVVPAFGLYHGRNMQHWAYIFPPLLVFLLPSGRALVGMVLYGVYVAIVTSRVLPMIDVVRFASGYGLLVCFIYTYALLEERAAVMLRYHSDHDALSNCLNRRTFNEAMSEIESSAAAGRRCTFLLIDIDHFKAINDQHGHLVGDRVITQVAAELGRQLNNPLTPLFRYGGEEFAVMLDGADQASGVALAERLCREIAGSDFQGVSVTVSIGVAEWRAGQGSVAAALGQADRSLYDAKHAGRNRVSALQSIENLS